MNKALGIFLAVVACVLLVIVSIMGTIMYTRSQQPMVAQQQFPPQQAMPLPQEQVPMYTQQDVERILQQQAMQQQPVPPPPQAAPNQPQPVVDPAIIRANAGKIIQLVSELDGVKDESGRNDANKGVPAIQVFFDPRCPYCHNLFNSIQGKAPVHWIPISALSPVEGGIAAGASIIQADKDKPGSGVALIRDAFDKKANTIAPTELHQKSLQDNYAAFAMLAQTLPPGTQPGVPLVIIPKADGTFETRAGYSPGDEEKIVGVYAR